MSLVIGIDGGTESIRAGVFDTADGRLIASFSCPYATKFPNPAWAEQNPSDWWEQLGMAVKGAVKQSGADVSSIKGLCIDTTCCTVCALDEKGEALRPALLWMDMRASQQADKVASCGDKALKVNSDGSGPVSAEWMIPKALWIAENEPEVWKKAHAICEYQDYINMKLTGRRCASVNNASVRWHYDVESGWPTSMLGKLGIPELQSKWPSELLTLGSVVGGLSPEAAAHLGLPSGLLVAQGGADAFVGMLGLGVKEAGQMALLTGSSHLQLGLVAKETRGRGIFGSYHSALLPGLHVIEGGQTSTGSIVNWFKNMLPPNITYEALDDEAKLVPEGSEGLTCLDHFQGNRTPHTDAASRGCMVGLTLKHTPAHIFRSLMEGVAFGTRLILDTMSKRGYRPDSIAIAGGATRSELWLQIHADVCNVPFVLPKCTEAPMLGCAILAAVAAGAYPDIATAVSSMVQVDRVIRPNPDAHGKYELAYQRYISLYPSLKPTFHLQPQPKAQGTTPNEIIISASILSADFSCLGDEIEAVTLAGSDWVHVDMFDGSYVDNFTLGPPIVVSLRHRSPDAFLDCHVACHNPSRYITGLAAAGASQMTFHAECCLDTAGQISIGKIEEVAGAIRSKGMSVGLAFAPETDFIVELYGTLVTRGIINLVLFMTVNPGFGGQKMIPEVLVKVKKVREAFPKLHIQVDGGVNGETAKDAVASGANVLVAGSAIYDKKSKEVKKEGGDYVRVLAQNIQQIRKK